jgi:cytidylate kinase
VYRIITVEREYGSGGGIIAEKLARQLGWTLWDAALTQEIAKLAHVESSAVQACDERLDSRLYRLSKVFWRGSYERSLPVGGSGAFDTDRMVAMVKQVVTEAAEKGNCVVVGRGAPYFLRQRADAFHVFLYAPRAEKMRRLREQGMSDQEAEEHVENVDAERIAFVKHYFNADWPTRCLYHMMINTAIGDENVVHAVLNMMHSLEAGELAALPKPEDCLKP